MQLCALSFAHHARAPARRTFVNLSPLAFASLVAWHSLSQAQVPPGTPQASTKGQFGPVFNWPLVPIHTLLLPSGQVLGYGTGTRGEQGANLHLAVWDPALGTGPNAMTLLDNPTGTDIFCGTLNLLPSGQALMLGGDRIRNGQRNFANDKVNLFDPLTRKLTEQPQTLAFQRWYASSITNADGDQVVMGGRIDRNMPAQGSYPATTDSFATMPEVHRQGAAWLGLSGANNPAVFGNTQSNGYYPKTWLAPDGRIAVLSSGNGIYALDTNGNGRVDALSTSLPTGRAVLPGAMFAPGRILSLRAKGAVAVVDLNGPQPVVSSTESLAVERQFGQATVLPDGSVWVNGGSSTGNDLAGAAYDSARWKPSTGQWTPGAAAALPRLYHSTALLLPDATVLTAGGGTPGPMTLLNGEIYYPPYLYGKKGEVLGRPLIRSGDTEATWGGSLHLSVGSTRPLARVTLVRAGAVTHNFNNEQRFSELRFTQSGRAIVAQIPDSRTQLPPGYYMAFVLNKVGVPSVARMIRIAGSA